MIRPIISPFPHTLIWLAIELIDRSWLLTQMYKQTECAVDFDWRLDQAHGHECSRLIDCASCALFAYARNCRRQTRCVGRYGTAAGAALWQRSQRLAGLASNAWFAGGGKTECSVDQEWNTAGRHTKCCTIASLKVSDAWNLWAETALGSFYVGVKIQQALMNLYTTTLSLMLLCLITLRN